jgi:phytoene dehydrogenase-like protein
MKLGESSKQKEQTKRTMEAYDIITVGSGHNALVAAALLARAGNRVLVLEKNDKPGGFVRTEEVTLPGFRHDLYATRHPLFLISKAYSELEADLRARGLEYLNTDLPTGVLLPDGRSAILSSDLETSAAEFDRLSPGDGRALADLMGDFGKYAHKVFPLFSVDLASSQGQTLIRDLVGSGKGGYAPFAAEFMQTARDVLNDRFRSPVAKALIAPWVPHLGRTLDSVSSGFDVSLLVSALMAGGMPLPRGGSEMLVKTLMQIVTDHGGAIRCDAAVDRILVERGRAVGVHVTEGETYTAGRAVIASVNADQLYLRLLADVDVPRPLVQQAKRYRYGLGCVQIQLALSKSPDWPDDRLRAGQPHLLRSMEACALAIAQAKNDDLPTEPTLSVDVPTQLDPSRAPRGAAIMRVQVLQLPCRPRGDAAGEIDVGDGTWTEDLKNRFADRIISLLGGYLPNVPGAILGRHVVSPDDLARYNPNSGPGDPYAGSMELAQSYLFRPLPGQPSHQTALPNVFLVGAGTWPGGGVNGGSGYIVAHQLLTPARTD